MIEEIDHKETLAPLSTLVSPLHTKMHLVRTAYAVKICELTETEAYWEENLGLRLTASVIFAENGNYKRAMKISEEITSIYQRLATANPAAYEPDLAASLNNLAIRYSESGRRNEAIAPAEKAVAIRKRLASENPSAYEPYLAGSLNNLANRYSESGRRNEAIAPAEKARDIYERLATENPAAYEPNLANSFGTLGTIYVELGKPLDGAVFFKRGIETLSRLFLQSPQYFSKLMANLVWCYEKNCSSDDEFQASDLYKKIVQVLKQQSSSTAED
ncbi:MAG: hypothetical protein C0620_07650 [Desulfuromonas sp.]|nr:MAG: hypothetical protein C0620_07650 [Desulfuromonas sp.]